MNDPVNAPGQFCACMHGLGVVNCPVQHCVYSHSPSSSCEPERESLEQPIKAASTLIGHVISQIERSGGLSEETKRLLFEYNRAVSEAGLPIFFIMKSQDCIPDDVDLAAQRIRKIAMRLWKDDAIPIEKAFFCAAATYANALSREPGREEPQAGEDRARVCQWLRQWSRADLATSAPFTVDKPGQNEKTLGYIAARMLEEDAARIARLEAELAEWEAAGQAVVAMAAHAAGDAKPSTPKEGT